MSRFKIGDMVEFTNEENLSRKNKGYVDLSGVVFKVVQIMQLVDEIVAILDFTKDGQHVQLIENELKLKRITEEDSSSEKMKKLRIFLETKLKVNRDSLNKITERIFNHTRQDETLISMLFHEQEIREIKQRIDICESILDEINEIEGGR